jgi:hypothetical protein
MTNDQEILRQIFLWILSRYRHAVSNLSGKPLKIHDLLASTYNVFQDVELERLFAESDAYDSLKQGKFLLMEPINLGSPMIPVLSFRYDFHRSLPEFNIRLGLFLFEKLGEIDELRAIGYRFESPEGEGIHHYYHAQGIHAFEKNSKQWSIPCPDWLPTKQPAFALDANCPVSLMACVLISLYGRNIISNLQSARFWDQFKTYVEALMSSNPTFQPTYWEVTLGKSTKFYKTWKGKMKFKQVMKGVDKASRVQEISFKDYYSQRENIRFVY